MIFIVDDAHDFHRENFKMNYTHYSGWSRRLPLSITSKVVQELGSKMYFHPLIPLKKFQDCDPNDQRKLKYGVIRKEDAIRDLTMWTRFALAGRMQKPILDVVSDSEVDKAHQTNMYNALSLAILMHFHEKEVDLLSLFTTLANFSYKGDIRMRWKMENPDKVANIVIGQKDRLTDLYQPFIS